MKILGIAARGEAYGFVILLMIVEIVVFIWQVMLTLLTIKVIRNYSL